MQMLSDFNPLSPAETKLVEASVSGEMAVLGEGVLPENDNEDISVRASLVRFLLLGGDQKTHPHEKGVRLRGAHIVGVLDMQGCDCSADLTLSRCVFEKPPSFINATMRGLHLVGSQCPGFIADNATFSGSVFLRAGFQSFGEISMPGVRIAGDLQICDATLSGDGRDSLFAASIRVEGSVYLGDYPYDDKETQLFSEGSVIFSSARISHDFFFSNTAIAPDDAVLSHSGFLDGEEGENLIALSLARAEIGGVLFAKKNQISGGIVNLSGAQVKRLNDEPIGEGSRHPVRLDGFQYQDFAQQTDISVKSRLIWLERRPRGIDFSAQPYEQLANVLTRIGHREDARDVLMAKEKLQRQDSLAKMLATPRQLWRWPLAWLGNILLRYVIGYGYRPGYALFWAVLMITLVAFFFQKTWEAGDMTPNSAPILVSQEWQLAVSDHPQNPGAFWSGPSQAGQDYETFHALAYAADIFVPIVNLGQEQAWAPSTTRSPLGRTAWWLRWVVKAVGWVVTALGAAAVTGIIRRD